VATQISTCSIALPVGPHVEEGDVETMVDAVRNVVEEMSIRA
jgi:dTDP-4-amino-4,6-dideoxygalactose transaminase